MKTQKTIVTKQEANFSSLQKAFERNQVALMECTNNATGEKEAIICASWIDNEGTYNFVPYARMINGNPYEMFTPPMHEI